MIGRASAAFERQPRRSVQRLWGTFDINARQKWAAVWPVLAADRRAGLTVLDAGCGDGSWAIELASRRPEWNIVGVDRDEQAIATARARAEALHLHGVQFVASDFLAYTPDRPFDVVLSVASVHYLVEDGMGEQLFEQIFRWLRTDGRLVLFVPRRSTENPIVSFLPGISGRKVFTEQELVGCCTGVGLAIESMHSCIGRAGTIAKQVSLLGKSVGGGAVLLYPVELLLDAWDGSHLFSPEVRSAFWLVQAHKTNEAVRGSDVATP